MKKNKDNNEKSKLSASTRINRNKLLLWIAREGFNDEMIQIRLKFGIPVDGFRTQKDLNVWHKLLCGDIENQFNVFQDRISSIIESTDGFHEGFRDAIRYCIVWDRIAWPDGFPAKKVGGNYRIFNKHNANDVRPWRSIFVEFLGPISKAEMLCLQKEVGKMMSSITKTDWKRPITSKENLQQAFDDHARFTSFSSYIDADKKKQQLSYMDLVEISDESTDKEINRVRETKRKSIRKFKQKIQKKK